MIIKGIFGDDQGRVSYPLLFIIILLAVALTLFIVILKLRSPAGKGFIDLPPPIEVIWTMYESAQRRDIDAYLDSFAQDSQASILVTLKSMGEEKFRNYLRNKAAGVMGVSIYSPDAADLNTMDNGTSKNQEGITTLKQFEGDMISLTVEIVFRERNEVQVFNLKRVGRTWKILNVSSPTLTPQPIPYGRNVNE